MSRRPRHLPVIALAASILAVGACADLTSPAADPCDVALSGYSGSNFSGYSGSNFSGYSGANFSGYSGANFSGYSGSNFSGYSGSNFSGAQCGEAAFDREARDVGARGMDGFPQVGE